MVGVFVLTAGRYKMYSVSINIEKLSKELLSLNVIKGLANVVSVSSQSLDVINMALRALTVLVEHGKLH